MPVLKRTSRWLHYTCILVATRRHTAHTREWYGSFFIRVFRDEKLRRFIFFHRTCRCAKDHAGCLPGVYTDDAGDNTDHPGWSGMRSVNVWKPLTSHIHGSHHGSSRILIRGPPACNTTILSQCRCEYVANWVLIRKSTVSTWIDKAAARILPERPRSEPGLHGWARKQLGFLRTCTFFTGIPPECWRCVEKRCPKVLCYF